MMHGMAYPGIKACNVRNDTSNTPQHIPIYTIRPIILCCMLYGASKEMPLLWVSKNPIITSSQLISHYPWPWWCRLRRTIEICEWFTVEHPYTRTTYCICHGMNAKLRFNCDLNQHQALQSINDHKGRHTCLRRRAARAGSINGDLKPRGLVNSNAPLNPISLQSSSMTYIDSVRTQYDYQDIETNKQWIWIWW